MYVDSDNPLKDNVTLIHRKMIARAVGGGERAYMDQQARPFYKLANNDLLDTADLCRVFGCSARTVYRWTNEHGLTPQFKAGRDLLFAKSDIVRWYAANRPRPGRPPNA